jgi:hypothetical protein
MTPMTALLDGYVCKHCGSDRGFDQHGSVECGAYRSARSAAFVDGKLTVSWGSVDVDTFDADDLDPDYVRCVECNQDATRLEDLLVTRVSREVVCHCGHMLHRHEEQPFDRKRHTRGLVACADCECEDFEAEAPHEVSPDQITLDVAA